ncbi:unnamed protein product [Gongylonema pulchrum]|uniref:AraC family transcriptional regulator n=1 Tax=Gongylonema pulchrum TaxID=637853 RepID=A0A183CUS1_9BILA|nr:unnamed protein product [Gongylonema pulchrum]
MKISHYRDAVLCNELSKAKYSTASPFDNYLRKRLVKSGQAFAESSKKLSCGSLKVSHDPSTVKKLLVQNCSGQANECTTFGIEPQVDSFILSPNNCSIYFKRGIRIYFSKIEDFIQNGQLQLLFKSYAAQRAAHFHFTYASESLNLLYSEQYEKLPCNEIFGCLLILDSVAEWLLLNSHSLTAQLHGISPIPHRLAVTLGSVKVSRRYRMKKLMKAEEM